MSKRPKKNCYSAAEAIDMIMNDPDSGDSDIDFGDDLSGDELQGDCDLDAESENGEVCIIENEKSISGEQYNDTASIPEPLDVPNGNEGENIELVLFTFYIKCVKINLCLHCKINNFTTYLFIFSRKLYICMNTM